MEDGKKRTEDRGRRKSDSSQADDLSSEQQSRRGRKSEDGKKKSPESWVSNPQFAIRNSQCLKPGARAPEAGRGLEPSPPKKPNSLLSRSPMRRVVNFAFGRVKWGKSLVNRGMES